MTVRKGITRKRSLVYSIRQDGDDKLDVFKRKRAPIIGNLNKQVSDDEDDGGKSSRRRNRSAKSRAKQAIAAGAESDTSSDADHTGSEPLVNLRQSIDAQDIEKIKKQNSGELKTTSDLLEQCESLLDDWRSIAKGRIRAVQVDQKELEERKMDIRFKYQKKFALPPVLYLSDLILRVQPFLQLVEDMFKNRIESYYKHEASDARKTSGSAFLSLDEFRSIDISKFLAGYYGLKRQLSIGQEILRQFKPFLLERQGETMRWWGVTDFANYVLAPEVLASLCIKDMGLGADVYDRETREKAYDIFNSTTEFGLMVADEEPLERWEVYREK